MIFVLVGVGSRTGSRRRLSCDRTPPPTPWAIDVLGSGSEVVGDGACIIFLECARTVRIHADGRDDLEINSVVGPPGMVVTTGIIATQSNVPPSHTLNNALMRVDNMSAVHWCSPCRRRRRTPSGALVRSWGACRLVVDSEATNATRPNRGRVFYAYATDAWGDAFRVWRGRRCRRAHGVSV